MNVYHVSVYIVTNGASGTTKMYYLRYLYDSPEAIVEAEKCTKANNVRRFRKVLGYVVEKT